MKVRELVDCTALVTTAAKKTLGDVCDIMKEKNISGLPVVSEAGELEGLISIGQVLHFAHDGTEEHRLLDPEWHSPVTSQPARGAWRGMAVEKAMVKDVITVSTDDNVEEAAKRLLGAGVHRAVVINAEKHPVGMLTSMDFTRLIANSLDR